MKKYKFLVALTTRDNDFQREQEAAAREAARRLGIDVDIIDSNNDPINQSQQLLQTVQSAAARPDAIIVEPIGTTLAVVTRAAAEAGIGWVVLNREVDYVAEIRRRHNIPIFSITSNHEEIGRIQGKQFTALLPNGGSVLYVEGPSTNSGPRQRTAGMYETKAANIQVKTLKGDYTQVGGQHAIEAWLRLSTSAQAQIHLIAAHNDVMAMGARTAFQARNAVESKHWLSLPYAGIDGVSQTGQKWVREGLLAATVVVPTNAGLAIEMLMKAFQGNGSPPEQTMTVASSLPSIEVLAAKAKSQL